MLSICVSVPIEIPRSEITVSKLMIETQRITDGYELGIALGIPRNELSLIYNEYNRDSIEAKRAMFTQWLYKVKNLSWNHISMAAYTVNYTNLALQLLMKYESKQKH